jgi:hypothetical protein
MARVIRVFPPPARPPGFLSPRPTRHLPVPPLSKGGTPQHQPDQHPASAPPRSPFPGKGGGQVGSLFQRSRTTVKLADSGRLQNSRYRTNSTTSTYKTCRFRTPPSPPPPPHAIVPASIPHGGRQITVQVSAGWLRDARESLCEPEREPAVRTGTIRPRMGAGKLGSTRGLQGMELPCGTPNPAFRGRVERTRRARRRRTTTGGRQCRCSTLPTNHLAGDAGSANLFCLPVTPSNRRRQTTRGIPRPRALHFDWGPDHSVPDGSRQSECRRMPTSPCNGEVRCPV